MPTHYKQGMFTPKNREKYKGDPDRIKFRSSYELAVMRWLDRRDDVISWSSENIIVPYYSSVKGKKRRYIVDIWMQYKTRNGDIKTILVEIKDSKQCKPPRKQKNNNRYIEEGLTWVTNNEKWAAAEKYAADRGWEFKIFTEKEIFG